MKNASPVAIQKAIGHRDLSTTQKYMHLSPGFVEDAIALLNAPTRGDIVETASR